MTRSDDPKVHRYFEIVTFPYAGHRLLKLVDETYRGVTTRALTIGSKVDVPNRPYRLTVSGLGLPMDVTSTAMGVLLASDRGADVLSRIAFHDVQLLPAEVDPHEERVWVVNLVHALHCLTPESKTSVAAAVASEHIQIPLYQIDHRLAAGHQIFRLADRTSVIIVGEELKDAILSDGLVGPGLASLDEPAEEIMPGMKRVE